MEKLTKLYKIFNNEDEYNLCINLYKHIKKSPLYTNNDLIWYKSIVKRIISAQNEPCEFGVQWAKFGDFIKHLMMKNGDSYDKTICNLFSYAKEEHAYNFNKETDFGKLI